MLLICTAYNNSIQSATKEAAARRNISMDLYHYFDRRTGPFRSITAISQDEARKVLENIRNERPGSFCAQRNEEYISKRLKCEARLRKEFTAIGGVTEIDSPHYMVLGASPWLSTWYEQSDYIKIPVDKFDISKISFTYGDSMPTFNYRDGKEYREKVYDYNGILKVIEKYGLPQEWNDDGKSGPERYIEAHVWTDAVIKDYLRPL